MKIHLKNFRCYCDREFDLGEFGITLLSGKSGTGKSTILEGILFAITGEGNKLIRHGEKSCLVELIENDIIVQRSKRPNTLVVKTTEHCSNGEDICTVYEEKIAQEVIDKRFGSEFEMTSYISQNSVKDFMSISPIEKLAFLERFAFHSLDLINIKNKLKTIIKEREVQLITVQSQINLIESNKILLSKSLLEAPFPIECLPKTMDANRMKKAILNEDVVKKLITNTVKRVDKGKSKIKKLYDVREALLKEIGDSKLILQQRMCKDIQVKKLFERVKDVDENIDNLKISELDDLKKTLSQVVEYNKLNEQLQQYRSTEKAELKHKKELLNKLWKRIPKQTCVDQLELRKQYAKEMLTCGKYKNFEIIDYDEKINTIQTQLNDARLSKNSMKCPQCNSNLVLKDKKLHLFNSVDTHDNIEMLESDLKREREKRKIYEEAKHNLQNSKKAIDAIKPKLVEYDFDLNKYYQENCTLEQELNKINVERYTNLRINTEKRMRELNLKDNELNEDVYREKILCLKEYSLKIKEKEIYIKELEELAQLMKVNVRDPDLIETELKNIIVDTDNLVSQTETYTSELKKLEEYLVFLKQKLEIKRVNDSLLELRKTEKVNTDQYNAAKLFKEKVAEAESLYISELISSINTHAGIYLDLFFVDDPISIELCPFKETKTAKKPQINVQVKYKGMDIDLNSLSGGERDRVYLAYTLALSEIFNTRLILLDECLSSLDQDNVYNVLHGMKETQQDRLILIIAHNFITGNFDRILEL